MRSPFFSVLACLIAVLASPGLKAQTITNGDGSPLTTQYCREDTNFPILGQPGGGSFSGCGVLQENGQWYFNPMIATEDQVVFPVQCSLNYSTPNGATLSLDILIWKPVVIAPPLEDTFTCDGEIYLHSKMLYAGAYNYAWLPAAPLDHPDSASTHGYITTTQTFVLTAIDQISGCIGRDTIQISSYPKPDLQVSNDTLIRARSQVRLSASGADKYRWTPPLWLDNDTIANPLAKPEAPLVYQVVGTTEFGCSDTGKVTITIREEMLVPNAFSPNGDGLNDVFRIENFGYQDMNRFRIFNRWGQKIFQTLDGTSGWDGTQNGLPVEAGTYYYDIQLELRDGTVKTLRGDLTLIR